MIKLMIQMSLILKKMYLKISQSKKIDFIIHAAGIASPFIIEKPIETLECQLKVQKLS